MAIFGSGPRLPRRDEALPGRAERVPVPRAHAVLGTPLVPPWPAGFEDAVFAMGCLAIGIVLSVSRSLEEPSTASTDVKRPSTAAA